MTFDFDPKRPGQTAADVAYQLDALACLFGAASSRDLDLTESALCGLMTQFFAMAEAMRKVEDHLGEIGAERAAA